MDQYSWPGSAAVNLLNLSSSLLPTFLPLPGDREDLAELSGSNRASVGVTDMGLEPL